MHPDDPGSDMRLRFKIILSALDYPLATPLDQQVIYTMSLTWILEALSSCDYSAIPPPYLYN